MLQANRSRHGNVAFAVVAAAILLAVAVFATADRSAGAKAVARRLDPHGGPVRGACFSLQAAGSDQQKCDPADGLADGAVTFITDPEGAYNRRQRYTPTGWKAPAPDTLAATATATATATAAGPNDHTLTSARTELVVMLRDQHDALVLAPASG